MRAISKVMPVVVRTPVTREITFVPATILYVCGMKLSLEEHTKTCRCLLNMKKGGKGRDASMCVCFLWLLLNINMIKLGTLFDMHSHEVTCVSDFLL